MDASSFSSLPDSLWPGVVAPNSVLYIGEIEMSDIKTESKQITYAKLTSLK